MKILLLGEFSAHHKALREGLLHLSGVEVDLIANGDGWKCIGGATGSYPSYPVHDLQSRIVLTKEQISFCKQLKYYDVIQLINPGLLSTPVRGYFFRTVRRKARCLSLMATGSDYRLAQSYLEKRFHFGAEKYNLEWTSKYNRHSFKGRMNIRNELWLERHADVIIPSNYEYTVGYTGSNAHSAIPFPVNVDEITYKENVVREKIVFFHGLNREKAKGTPFIREAMERLAENYPQDVEIVLDGHMPYDKYVQIMRRANVVLDQCLASTYGINGCIAMAQGKVLMAGNTPEFQRTLRIENCPVLHIGPDADQIYSQMEWLVKNRDQIPELGRKSREFAEKYHHYKLVAQQFLDAWKTTGTLVD